MASLSGEPSDHPQHYLLRIRHRHACRPTSVCIRLATAPSSTQNDSYLYTRKQCKQALGPICFRSLCAPIQQGISLRVPMMGLFINMIFWVLAFVCIDSFRSWSIGAHSTLESCYGGAGEEGREHASHHWLGMVLVSLWIPEHNQSLFAPLTFLRRFCFPVHLWGRTSHMDAHLLRTCFIAHSFT